MKEVDWLELWRELITRNFQPETEGMVEKYKAKKENRTERPDPLLDFVLNETDEGETAIDIGPGTGRWTIPLAKRLKSVTAVEPTPGMLDMLRENLDAAGLANVNILPRSWEDATPSIHDITFCAHGMYGSPDLASFVRKMECSARKRCYLALRLLPADGIMAELSMKIYGCRHDNADAVIAYNALYSMGIYANMLVEKDMFNWVNSTREDAFRRARKHLCLEPSQSEYDELIHSTLKRRLRLSDGVYVWPDGMRSALLWWAPAHRAPNGD